ncbi:MAG TPA: TIGR02588 family protein [Pyrinomonadaceae bacterium]|nr:TIGR02588 family protein [Pyrinomonadaceae bacterium]
MGNSSSNENRNKNKQPSVWEWIVAFIGLILVVGAIGFMLYKAVWVKDSSPDVEVQIESVEQVNNGYLVKFRALNRGGTTAAGLIIEAELKRGAEKIETNQTTIDFLPSNSVRNGGFFFTNDPQQNDLQIRAVGYQQP